MNKSIKIALLLPRLSKYGGVEQFSWRLAETLAKEGYEVHFICARQEVEAPAGVRVLITGRRGLLRFFKLLYFIVRAEQARKKGGYDLTIALGHCLHQDILRVGGGPLQIYNQLSIRAWPQGFPRLFKQIRRRLSPVTHLILWLEKRQYRRARTIVCVSDNVRRWCRMIYPQIDPLIIYNAPDLSCFSPPTKAQRLAARKRFGFGDQEIIISTAASNFALKGLRPLIKAMTLLPENVFLLVAGGRNHAEFAALAEKRGLGGRVRFIGQVSEMPVLYHASDLFALPSFYDACSNAVLEALACGLKTLSSADNGSSVFLPPEWIIKDPADWRDMAAHLQTMIESPKLPLPENPAAGRSGLGCWLDLIRSLTGK